MVDFGDDEGTTEEQRESAIGPGTAAVYYWMDETNLDAKVLTLRRVIKIAHRRNTPVNVDAAGQVYPQRTSTNTRAGAPISLPTVGCMSAHLIQPACSSVRATWRGR